MKKILIPTDFSENARKALEYALTIFNNGEKFYLLHVYDETNTTEMMVSVDDILQKDAEEALQKEINILSEKGYNTKNIEPISICGGLEIETERVVEKHNIDIIVMGTKGASGIKEVLIGSNTANIIKRAIRPLIAVPFGNFNKPKNIVLPLDFEHFKNSNVLAPLKEIASKFNSTINILYIAAPNDNVNQADNRAIIDNFFGDINHTYHYIESEDVVENINKFAHEKQADLIAMVPRRGNFFDNIFHKSVTNKIALKTDIPLLAINDLTF